MKMSVGGRRLLLAYRLSGRQLSANLLPVQTCQLSTSIMDQRVITLDNMNPFVKKMEYAVRGPLVIRATALEKELQAVSSGVRAQPSV